MPANQNETIERRARSTARRAGRPGAPGHGRTNAAFTLTELLVVIGIIAVLAALGTAAALRAWNTAKRAAIQLELDKIEIAIDNLKNSTDFGSYPPNAVSPPSFTDSTGRLIAQVHSNDMVLMFKRAFPRSREPESLIRALAGQNFTSQNVTPQLEAGMSGAEALVFWLGGFSKDDQYPISGQGGPSFLANPGVEDFTERNFTFEFDLARLGPRNASGNFDENKGRFITYRDPRDTNVVRRINFWTYNADGSTEPIYYFDTSRYRASLEDGTPNYDPWFYAEGVGVDERYAIKQPNATNSNRIEFANQGRFQLIHCGIDDLWGDFTLFSIQRPGGPIVYPVGPFLGEIADTVTNFAEGSLEDDQQ